MLTMSRRTPRIEINSITLAGAEEFDVERSDHHRSCASFHQDYERAKFITGD
jgi:hypothetical protein